MDVETPTDLFTFMAFDFIPTYAIFGNCSVFTKFCYFIIITILLSSFMLLEEKQWQTIKQAICNVKWMKRTRHWVREDLL